MNAAAGPLAQARHDLDRGRPDRALEALGSVEGRELESPRFWRLRTEALYGLRRWDEAVRAAQQGLARQADDLPLLDLLALGHFRAGRRKEARSAIDAALERHPDVAILHAHRGLILAGSVRKSFRLTSYRKAREAVDHALQLDPECEPALRIRTHIATLSRDPHAGEYGSEILARDPDDAATHAVAGAALARRGNLSDALDHYVEAARLDPSNPSLVWLGRRGRTLQRPFAAPLRLMFRLSRGRLRFVWAAVAVASLQTHQPILMLAVFALWAYMWGVYLYMRFRFGKVPR